MPNKTALNLHDIRQRFLEILALRVEKIEHQLRLAQHAPAQSSAALHEIESVLHQIAGTAGTLGFAPLGEHARAVETDLFDIRMGAKTCTNATFADIQDFLDAGLKQAGKAA